MEGQKDYLRLWKTKEKVLFSNSTGKFPGGFGRICSLHSTWTCPETLTDSWHTHLSLLCTHDDFLGRQFQHCLIPSLVHSMASSPFPHVLLFLNGTASCCPRSPSWAHLVHQRCTGSDSLLPAELFSEFEIYFTFTLSYHTLILRLGNVPHLHHLLLIILSQLSAFQWRFHWPLLRAVFKPISLFFCISEQCVAGEVVWLGSVSPPPSKRLHSKLCLQDLYHQGWLKLSWLQGLKELKRVIGVAELFCICWVLIMHQAWCKYPGVLT